MRAVIERTLVAFLVLGVGSMLAPLAVVAATLNHAGFGAHALVRPGQVPPVAMSAVPPPHRLAGWEPLHHRRRVFGFDLPVAGIGPFYGPTIAPTDFGTGFPVAVPGAADGVPVDRAGCRIEERTVPSESGGARTVRITRCWPG